MKQIIDYSKLSGKEKEDKAIQDCKDFLGEKSFKNVVMTFKKLEEPILLEKALFYISLVGIEGYPAEVFAKRYVKLIKEEDDVTEE